MIRRGRHLRLRAGALGAAGLLLAAPAGTLAAHDGVPPAPHDLWQAWPASPLTAILLVVVAAGYARGVRRLWRRAGRGRVISGARVRAFAAGIAALALALLSPLDSVAEALFSAHMVQHLMLVAVAAPLLVLGRPELALLWALPLRHRRALARWWLARTALRRAWASVTRPLPAVALHTAVLWGWHAPGPYEAALAHGAVHVAEHVTLLASAVLFWRMVDRPGGAAARDRALVLLATFVAAMQGAVLGALITFAGSPWYPAHAPWTRAWGLTPLADQELAGLIMWIPVGPVYIAAAGVVLYRMLGSLPVTSPAAPPPAVRRSTGSVRSGGTRSAPPR